MDGLVEEGCCTLLPSEIRWAPLATTTTKPGLTPNDTHTLQKNGFELAKTLLMDTHWFSIDL